MMACSSVRPLKWPGRGSRIEPFWNPPRGVVPVNLSIKNVPDEIAEQLRRQAVVRHPVTLDVELAAAARR